LLTQGTPELTSSIAFWIAKFWVFSRGKSPAWEWRLGDSPYVFLMNLQIDEFKPYQYKYVIKILAAFF